MSLLTENNPKILKGLAKGYLSAVLHLAHAKKSGYNVCPWASPECIKLCLDDNSGRGRMPQAKEARIRRTRLLFEHPEVFKMMLERDIQAFIRKAERKGLKPALRLNGTSDLPELAIEFARKFPTVQFYDYTKGLETLLRDDLPSNYHLTFSRSEVNEKESQVALANGYNLAVVFEDKPETYNGYPVVDGDEDDLRFLDPKGVVIALSDKGNVASRSERGFVVRGA